ncbi:hypothetical protein [Streptomyces sp. NPDC056982]|uniref:hypothetical protein n=1 Tax=Streptomyces sp. NPDC056982 TaxID=3345986 RepID=UPI003633789C
MPLADKVTCFDNCAKLWPAATTTDARNVTVKGVDKKLVPTVKRPDGTTRITLAGRPLHRYAKDDEPKRRTGGAWTAHGSRRHPPAPGRRAARGRAATATDPADPRVAARSG